MKQISIIITLLFVCFNAYSIPVVKDTTEALAVENSGNPDKYELDLTGKDIKYIRTIRFSSKYKNMYSLKITNNKSFNQKMLDTMLLKMAGVKKIVLTNNSLTEFKTDKANVFSSCTYIDLSYNSISNLSSFKLSPNVDTLILNNNNINNIEIDDPYFPVDPRLKSKLKYLDVSNNSTLTLDTSLTNNMPEITVFKASKTRISKLGFIKKFPVSIRVIELNDNNIQEMIPTEFGSFMNLEVLKISGQQIIKPSFIAKECLSQMKNLKNFNATSQYLYWERFPKNAKKGDVLDTLPNCAKLLSALGYEKADSIFITVREKNYTLLKANRDLNKDSIITNIVTFSHPVFGKFTSVYNESDEPTAIAKKDREHRLVPQQIKSLKIKSGRNYNSGIPIDLDADSLNYTPNLSYSQAEVYRKGIPYKVKWKVVSGLSNLVDDIDTNSVLPSIVFKKNTKGTVVLKITAGDSSGVSVMSTISCGYVEPEEIIIQQDTVKFQLLDKDYNPTNNTLTIIKPDTILTNQYFDLNVIIKPKEAINNDTIIYDRSKFRLIESKFHDSLIVYRLKTLSSGKTTITLGSASGLYRISKDFYIVENEEFLLAPNPVKDGQIELYFESEENGRRVLIYDTGGRLISNEVYNAIHYTNNKISPTTGKKWYGIVVDVSVFTAGSYIVKIVRGGQELIKNFVVE